MADHTITSTAAQEKLLTAIVAKSNLDSGTKRSNTEYIQWRFDRLMNEAASKDRDRRFDALSDVQKTTALAAGER